MNWNEALLTPQAHLGEQLANFSVAELEARIKALER